MSEQTQKKALRIPAHIISYLLHPVFMPTVMTIVLYKLIPTSFAGITYSLLVMRILFTIVLSTIFFPLFTLLLMKALGFLDNFQLQTSKERIIPLLASMVFYWWAYHVADSNVVFKFPFLVTVLLLGSYLGIIGIFLINIFFKISMHTTAAGGVLGLMVILMMSSPVNMAIPFFISLFLAGLVGTARKIVGTHSNPEIWMGYVVGFIVQMIAYWWLA